MKVLEITHASFHAVAFSSNMYLKVVEWDIDQKWKDDNIVDFWIFCDLLSNQTIKYNLTHQKYLGSANMIPDTKKNQYEI